MFRKCMLFLSLGVIGLAGCNRHPASSLQPKKNTVAAGEIGSRLPDFSMSDLQGRRISSADLRGKVVLIDFWATWCEPCKREMPGYQKLLTRYGSDGFAVIGFKFDVMADTEDPVLFAERIGVRYPLAVAVDDLKQKFGGIEGLPTTMLYDRQGAKRKLRIPGQNSFIPAPSNPCFLWKSLWKRPASQIQPQDFSCDFPQKHAVDIYNMSIFNALQALSRCSRPVDLQPVLPIRFGDLHRPGAGGLVRDTSKKICLSTATRISARLRLSFRAFPRDSLTPVTAADYSEPSGA